ncbi:hypothetical protein C2845_PM01G14150 [Panicum miliaceum]|uniref:Retrotransposon gag domain-containing protein n=1 Tax=Panicum miliaceum TaxID=4540 RepID=A0A3L6TWF4_PANMI|nr:hypothetical protein C2845_PM01G14150 [Panicum miliaceum]
MASSPSSSSSAPSGNPFWSLSHGAPPPAATIAVLNIHGYVPVTLDMDEANFRQWRTFFELTFQKFSLDSHIDGSLDAALMRHDAEWLQIDASIVSWLYSTVDKSIMDVVYAPRNSAFDVWTAINGLFLDNSLQRAVYTQQEFHSLYQGDMSIRGYCGRLKKLSDTLRDVGAAVTDQALVINTLRGLNSKFSQAITVLGAQRPPPTFLYTRSYLMQEEKRIEHSMKMEAQTALLAAGSTSNFSKPPTPPQPPSQPPSGGNDRRKKRKAYDSRNRGPNNGASGNGNGNGSRPHTSPSPSAPPHWASSYNPWTGVVQAWPLNAWRPQQPSVLGSRPGVSPPQAMAVLSAPTPPADNFSYPGNTSLVPSALFSALHGMQAQQPAGGGGDWFLDTGASTHMASNAGSSHQDDSSPM